jgi:predicted PurR-regulated permease PerM
MPEKQDNSNNQIIPETATGSAIQITVNPRLAVSMKRTLWIAAGIALALWFAYLVREIWIPLTIAFIIAMVLDPVVDRMEARGWSRLRGSLIIFIGFFAVLGTALYFAVPAVIKQAEGISGQISQYIPEPGNQAKAEKSLQKMLDRAKAPPFVRSAVERAMGQLNTTVTRSTTWLSAHGMEILSNLIWLVIIPIVTFYALKDFHLIFAKSLLLVPREKRDFVQTMVAEITAIFAKYLRGLMLVSALNGTATWILLLLLRTPNSFALGAIAGLLYSIPYIGALTTIVLVAVVSFIAGGAKYMLLVVALNIILHQFLFDQIITPRILGGHVGLHPILSIIALLSGNVLLGVLGMLLAVPVAASIQMVVLTLVPKLSHEIDIPTNLHDPPDTVESLSQETKDTQVVRDATEELHRSVGEAVENAEAKAEEASIAAEEVAEAKAAEAANVVAVAETKNQPG